MNQTCLLAGVCVQHTRFIIQYINVRYFSNFKSVFIFTCLFPVFLCSDSNLNRYEVHPTRTVSEAIGPEFYTHLRVNLSIL